MVMTLAPKLPGNAYHGSRDAEQLSQAELYANTLNTRRSSSDTVNRLPEVFATPVR